MTDAVPARLPPSPAPGTCYAYLVRHGATPASAAHPVIMQGRNVDAALSAVGERQAEETARFLSARQLDAVYASPMHRAQQTATAIGKPHHLKVIPTDAIIEADLGTWEGLSWDDIRRQDLDAYQKFIAQPDVYGYGGGESITAVRDRAATGHRVHSRAACRRHRGDRHASHRYQGVRRAPHRHAAC